MVQHYTKLISWSIITLIGLAFVLVPTQRAQAAWSLPLMPLWWLQPSKAKTKTTESPKPSPTPIQEKKVEARFLPQPQNRLIEQAKAADERPVVAAWHVPWGDESFDSFKNNLDKITEIHPFIYSIGSDGVSITQDEGDWHEAEVMQLAKEHNILVIPTIHSDNVNYSDAMLNDPAKRAAHIDEIVKLIEEKGYDGFNIDFEGFMNGYNRDVYATFMTDLSKELHARGKILAISIEAFNRLQDWETIGKAVDRFMIMGYDYHSARGPKVGPIGPANWLKEVVDYSATRVDKKKIVLGLGTYGYAWIHDGNQYVSEAVGYFDALRIAEETGSTIQRDNDAPFVTYNRGQGERHLYFEDAKSTAPKLKVAKDAEIGGVAFWRLGVEDPKIWDEIGK